jgi:membrane associated rhomboid family serine protease
MGIQDRDYYQRSRPAGSFSVFAHTAVGTIIVLNLVCWIAQLATNDTDVVTRFLACSGNDIFAGFPKLWKLVTACFAHSTGEAVVFHILWNMLFLYWFGKDLEEMYGKRDFWFFYLLAGALAVLAEVGVQYTRGEGAVQVIGASGGVMGVVLLFTMFYPRRTIYLFFLLPVPMWVACLVFIGGDLHDALSFDRDGVANLAHLTGAACGFFFWRFDLRWTTFWAPLLRIGRRGRAGGRRASRAVRKARASPPPRQPVPDPISERIDQLLAKVQAHGMGSLTDEERDFMVENSRRYRSR